MPIDTWMDQGGPMDSSVTRYAWRTRLHPLPYAAEQGCPDTGWVHEGAAPWRVIVLTEAQATARTAGRDTVDRWLVPYDGDEATVPWSDLAPTGAR
jgi:hypothetical protein